MPRWPKKPAAPVVEGELPAPTPITPDLPKAVVPVVPEKVRAKIETGNREFIRELIEEMMPALVAAGRVGQAPVASVQAAVNRKQRCPDCRQNLITGCKGEHEMMVVYPVKDPSVNGPWFPGCYVNGERYLSDGPDTIHAVLVPKSCVGDFKHQIRVYEDNEQQLARGRKATHNSGDLANPKPANAAWR